jgi:uncharacterized protein YqeY
MLREQLNEALKTAMRARDQETVGAIRLVLAALKDKDIAARPSGNATGIGDPEILALLQAMVKQRRESAALYHQGGREDLVAKEEAEIAVIERFMPRQLGPEETDAVIAAVIAETGAASIKDMGKVMAVLKAKYAGQIDFSAAGPAVKARIGG